MSGLQIPDYLAKRQLRAVAPVLESLGAGSVPYISVKGNRFLLVDAAGNEKPAGAMDPKHPEIGLYLDAVIVDANPHRSKIYYKDAYDPSASEFLPPTCFSDNGVGPSSQAQTPQAKLCSTCPNNKWGSETSRLTGRDTKACNDVQKVAVLLPGTEMIFLLRVPPASLKHLGRYTMSLKALSAGGRQVDITELVTRISFDQSAVGILQFQPASFIDQKTAGTIDRVWQNDETAVLLGKNDKPFEGEIAGAIAAPAVQERRLPPPDAAQIGQAAVAAAVEQPKRKPGRPPKNDPAPVEGPRPAPFLQGGGTATPDDDIGIPAFLNRQDEGGQAPVKAPLVQGGFGMAEAAPAPNDMAERIRQALELPT